VSLFEDWKSRAQKADILQEAVTRGAILKRAGKEHIGPCPACGGTDRFSVNPTKQIFNCRGAIGGDVIGLLMHLDGMSFTQACEVLTGEPPPNGQSKPLGAAEVEARAKQRREAEARQRQRKAEQDAHEEDTKEAALAIWMASKPLRGTIAEKYLQSRGLGMDAYPDVLRFHPSLSYPNGKRYPALICRGDDVVGELTAIWRIYLRDDGRKADVPNCKLGLGPAGGGAVRIGGLGPKIGIAEGVESALSFWLMIDRKYPVWAALSTSGMIGFEVPLGVDHVQIAPDGDAPIKRLGDEYVPSVPAGRKAALTLRSRLLEEGTSCSIAVEPPPGKDMNDLWLLRMQEVA